MRVISICWLRRLKWLSRDAMAAVRKSPFYSLMLWWRWLRRNAIRRQLQQLPLADEQIYFAPF